MPEVFQIYTDKCLGEVTSFGTGADSQIALWGSESKLNGSENFIFDGSTLALIGNETIIGDLRFLDGIGGNYAGFAAPTSVDDSYIITLPANVASSSGQSLVTIDNSGTLEWKPTISGVGTNNQIVLWDGTSMIDGSINLSFNGNTLSLVGNETIDGELRLNEPGGVNYAGFVAPQYIIDSYTLEMPSLAGSEGEALIADGIGSLEWKSAVVGTGADNQVAVWNGTSDMGGSSNLTFDGNTLGVSGDIQLLDSAGGEYVGIKAPPVVDSSYTLEVPPSAGDVGQSLVTTDTEGTLKWSSVTFRDFVIQSNQITVNSNSPVDIAFFAWDQAEYGSMNEGIVIYYLANISSRSVTLTVYNHSTASSIGSHTIAAGSGDGIQKLSITNPTADARLSFRVNKSIVGGVNPQIYGIQLKFK